MTALATLLVLYTLGLTLSLAWGPRRYPELCTALAFPIGVLAASMLLLGSLFFDLPPRLVVGMGGLAVFGIAARRLQKQWSPTRREGLLISCGVLAFLIIAAAFTFKDVSTASYTSYKMILTAQLLGVKSGGYLEAHLFKTLSELGGLSFAAHGIADLLCLDYLSALQPLLYVATCVFIVGLLRRAGMRLGTSRWVVLGVAATVAFFLTQPAMAQAGLKIGSAAFISTYSVIAVALWWLAEVEDDSGCAALASPCLLALFLLSDWGAVLGIGLLAILAIPSRLRSRCVDVALAASVAAAIVWLGSAGQTFPSTVTHGSMTRGEAHLLLAGLLCVYVLSVVIRVPRLRSIVDRNQRWAASGVISLAIIAIAVLLGGPQGIEPAWKALVAGHWKLDFIVLVPCAVVGGFVGRLQGERIFALACILLVSVLLCVAATAEKSALSPPLGQVQLIASQLTLFLSLHVSLKLVWLFSSETGSKRAQPEKEPIVDGDRRLAVATVALLAGLVVFNVHQLQLEAALHKGKNLGTRDDNALATAVRSTGRTVRQRFALYVIVASKIHGRLRLPPELEHHASRFRLIAGLDVEVGSAAIPAAARARLDDEIDDSVDFRAFGGDNRIVYMIFEPEARDWVLATTPDDGPFYLLSRRLFLEVGGTP